MKLRSLGLGAFAFALIFLAGQFLLAPGGEPPSARAEPSTSASKAIAPPSEIRVIDGDTIEDMGADITYRIVNIDTPETGPRAQCAAERDLGNRATTQARALITTARDLELRPTGRIDRYGRTIAFVLIDGRDLGETLIAEGLARPWRGRREPWCDVDGNLIP
jgi:micrococcal nuclease